jgi:hypothetical protein
MGLDEEAVSAVKQWKLRPSTFNGQLVPVRTNIEITFSAVPENRSLVIQGKCESHQLINPMPDELCQLNRKLGVEIAPTKIANRKPEIVSMSGFREVCSVAGWLSMS